MKYSYKRILDPEVGSGASWHLAGVVSSDGVDDYTIATNLVAPCPGRLAKLGGYKGMAIVPEGVEGLDRTPVGTGPFRFIEYVPVDRVILARNEQDWETDADAGRHRGGAATVAAYVDAGGRGAFACDAHRPARRDRAALHPLSGMAYFTIFCPTL